jgi:hypothetical protein
MIYAIIWLWQSLKELLDTLILVKVHVVQTDFGAHPAPYPVGTEGYLPGGKATVA